MRPVTPSNQPTTPEGRVVSLGPALDAQRLGALDRELLLRLERGFHLVALGAVTALGPSVWRVRGRGGAYTVVRHGHPARVTCDCRDFVLRQRACKHVAAALIHETLGGGGGPVPPATATHRAVPSTISADTAVDPDCRVWPTPLGVAAGGDCWDTTRQMFRRIDAAMYRHHERTGHGPGDCAAQRRADVLWQELAGALGRLAD